jgi:DNA-binding NtrC family response regulator
VEPPSHTVLVVDDDQSIRFLCRVNLELDGWTVREAGTLDEARRELAEGPIAVVLLDVHIGSQNSADLLAEIRAVYPRVAVALLTGSIGTTSLDPAAADGVVPKPFTLEQLRQTVRALVPRSAQSAG